MFRVEQLRRKLLDLEPRSVKLGAFGCSEMAALLAGVEQSYGIRVCALQFESENSTLVGAGKLRALFTDNSELEIANYSIGSLLAALVLFPGWQGPRVHLLGPDGTPRSIGLLAPTFGAIQYALCNWRRLLATAVLCSVLLWITDFRPTLLQWKT